MGYLVFSTRNSKEILRDPMSLVFGIGFPLVLILLISFMTSSIEGVPQNVFGIEVFAPGMAVFGLSFISLFLGMLIANDRNSSFLLRLFATPLSSWDFIIGYSLPLLPIAIIQSIVCFGTAAFVGLELNVHILLALLVLIPVAILYISFGLLLGSLLSSNQVGAISSILVNVAALLSGTWFGLDMIGGVFRDICYLLPFAHAVDLVKVSIAGDYAAIFPHLLWVLGYSILIFVIAVSVFRKQMRS